MSEMSSFDWRETIKINLSVLRFVGLWPQGYETYKLDLYLLYSLLLTITIMGGNNLSAIVNIFYIYNDLEALTATVFITVTTMFAVLKRYLFVRNLKVIKNLLLTLSSHPFLPKTDSHKEIIESSVKSWKTAYVWFTASVYLNLVFWSSLPIVNKWPKDHKLLIESWYPFKTNKSPNYELTYVYQVMYIWYTASGNLNLDTLVFAFMTFIAIQCDILKEKLKNLDNKDNFDEELVECIKHHKKILSFAEKSNEIFNFTILGQIVTSTATLALTLFQLAISVAEGFNGVLLIQLTYILSMFAEIFLYCWFGNEVDIKSSQILNAVYESEWFGQTRQVSRNLLILGFRCQKPIRIAAINLFTLSLQTFINISRTAWSYFAVLSTINE